MLWLMQHAKRVVLLLYEGDSAGWKGLTRQRQRLRAVGLQGRATCCQPVHLTKDPKDMDLGAISRGARRGPTLNFYGGTTVSDSLIIQGAAATGDGTGRLCPTTC